MPSLVQSRVILLVLGAIGVPLSLLLLRTSAMTISRERRRTVRQVAILFYCLAFGIFVLNLGTALVCAFLLMTLMPQSLLPAVIQISAMSLFDFGLAGMLFVNRQIEREIGRKR